MKSSPNIFITVDNELDEFLVNGVSILSVVNLPNARDYNNIDSFYYPISPSDTISITGHNTGGPNAMIFSIHYFDANGNQKIINSGVAWTCEGKPAITRAKNGVWPWRLHEAIDSNAFWICSDNGDVNVPVTCTFTLPPPEYSLSDDDDCDK